MLIPPAVKELKERGRRELLADVEANPRIPEKAKEEMRRMVLILSRLYWHDHPHD